MYIDSFGAAGPPNARIGLSRGHPPALAVHLAMPGVEAPLGVPHLVFQAVRARVGVRRHPVLSDQQRVEWHDRACRLVARVHVHLHLVDRISALAAEHADPVLLDRHSLAVLTGGHEPVVRIVQRVRDLPYARHLATAEAHGGDALGHVRPELRCKLQPDVIFKGNVLQAIRVDAPTHGDEVLVGRERGRARRRREALAASQGQCENRGEMLGGRTVLADVTLNLGNRLVVLPTVEGQPGLVCLHELLDARRRARGELVRVGPREDHVVGPVADRLLLRLWRGRLWGVLRPDPGLRPMHYQVIDRLQKEDGARPATVALLGRGKLVRRVV